MAFWIHPAWKDIFLRVRKEMGDEVISYYFNNNQDPKLKLPPFVKKPLMSLREIDRLLYNPSTIFQDNKWLRKYDNLKIPLEINKEELKTYLYNIGWEYGGDSRTLAKYEDYSKPLKEIYLYDVFFLRAFNSMLYDDMGYFSGDDEEIEQVSELKNKIGKICFQVWEEKYGREWERTTPFVNSRMQDVLFLGYLGYPIPFDDYDEWSWIMLQLVKYGTWVEEINRNDSISKKALSNLTPYQWFSVIWQPKRITKPFMNWNISPFNKT